MVVAILVSLVVLCVLYIFVLSIRTNRKWPSQGVPQSPTVPFFGSSLKQALGISTAGASIAESWHAFPNARYFGYVEFFKPYLVIKDMSLIESILIKDFHHFTDHGEFQVDEDLHPHKINLFSMEGNRWRALRNKFSPMFTTGKLREMTGQMSDISLKMLDPIRNSEMNGINLKETVFARFSGDVIASCAFGFESHSDEFFAMGMKSFSFTYYMMFKRAFVNAFPRLGKWLGVTWEAPGVREYFSSIIRQMFQHRRSTGQFRNDFVQMMLSLKDKGFVEVTSRDPGDEYLDQVETVGEEHYEITDNILIGNAFVFLAGGFDGIASILAFACYELALNLEIQEKARREVLAGLPSGESEIHYDILKNFTYLDNCIKETMRKYPLLQAVWRVCTKDYKVPDSSLVIERGTPVLIPVYAIHYDPELHPDPNSFKPERFEEGVPKLSYMPFGEGPRLCIAMRLVLTEVRCALARLLATYSWKLNEKSQGPLKMKKRGFQSLLGGPLYFDLTPLS